MTKHPSVNLYTTKELKQSFQPTFSIVMYFIEKYQCHIQDKHTFKNIYIHIWYNYFILTREYNNKDT